jgi:hypothetical protein
LVVVYLTNLLVSGHEGARRHNAVADAVIAGRAAHTGNG